MIEHAVQQMVEQDGIEQWATVISGYDKVASARAAARRLCASQGKATRVIKLLPLEDDTTDPVVGTWWCVDGEAVLESAQRTADA